MKITLFLSQKIQESAFVTDHLHEKVFSSRTSMFPFFRHILDLWVFVMNLSFFHTAQLSSKWLQIDVNVLSSSFAVEQYLGIWVFIVLIIYSNQIHYILFFSFMKCRNPVVVVVEQTRRTLTWLIMLSTCPKKNLCHIIASKIPIWGFRQGSNFIRNYQSYLSIPLVSIVVSFLLKPPYFYRSVRSDVSVRVGVQ